MELTIDMGYAALGAAISLGLAGAGTAIGLGFAGVAGTAILSEDPNKFGSVLVWNALPQTQMIYGFLVAILIMLGAGLIGGEGAGAGAGVAITEGVGIIALGAGIVTGVAGLSGIGQGSVCAGGAIATAKRPDVFGQSLVLGVLAETPAIFGVVIAVLMLLAIGFL